MVCTLLDACYFFELTYVMPACLRECNNPPLCRVAGACSSCVTFWGHDGQQTLIAAGYNYTTTTPTRTHPKWLLHCSTPSGRPVKARHMLRAQGGQKSVHQIKRALLQGTYSVHMAARGVLVSCTTCFFGVCLAVPTKSSRPPKKNIAFCSSVVTHNDHQRLNSSQRNTPQCPV